MSADTNPSPGVERWRQRFKEAPINALDGALTGRMNLDRYNALSPSAALRQMIADDEVMRLDKAMKSWLSHRINQELPRDLSLDRYSGALVEAFRTIQSLSLPLSHEWCVANEGELHAWLEQFNGDSINPASALMVNLKFITSGAKDEPQKSGGLL